MQSFWNMVVFALVMSISPGPVNLVALAGGRPSRGCSRGAPGRAELWLVAGVLMAAAVGALAPTPSWLQYYFVLFPFFALGAL